MVVYLTHQDLNNDLLLAGYCGRGWYFWDEVGANCYGPFESQDDAAREEREYAKQLG